MEIVILNLTPEGVTPNTHASQFDNGRVIRFMLKDGASTYTLAGTETITAKITRSDLTETTVAVANTSSNYVDLVTDADTCPVSGVYACELSIVDGGVEIGSINFALKVQRDPYDGKNIRIVTVGPADICTFDATLPEPYQSVLVNVEATGGNGTPDSPIPINGYTEANLTRCGVNLFSVNSRVGQTTAYVTYTSDDNYIYLNGTKNGGGYAVMSGLTATLPTGTYYLKAFAVSGTASNTVSLYGFDGSGNITADLLGGERTLTLSEPTTFGFRFAVWADGTVLDNYRVGIVITTASGISAFTPYNGTTYAVSWQDEAGTVYGGNIDLTTGLLTVTHGIYTITGSETFSVTSVGQHILATSNPMYSTMKLETDNNNVADMLCTIAEPNSYNNLNVNGATDGIGIGERFLIIGLNQYENWANCAGEKICYPLITPVTYQLTPTQVRALVGVNNVFADCGQTTVEYLDEE